MEWVFSTLQRKNISFAALLLCGLLGMTARNAVDPDLWWHLRAGQWIVETGHIPHVDPFSFTRAGHAWVSHEWLLEVAFFELWKHGGFAGLIIFSAIVTTAGFMLLYLRCPGRRHWAVAATVAGALAAAPSWGSRPQMFTFALASALLWLIERGEDRPRLLLWIPPLFLLWVNLHAGFALGLALMLAYGIGLLVETDFGTTPWHQTRPILLRVLFLLLVCFGLVALNPNGTHLYRYPLETLRSPGMRSLIGEWFSPDFHQVLYRPLLLLWFLLLVALFSSRSRPKGRIVVPLLLTGFAALDAVRHIPIFVLLAVPVIASAMPRDSITIDRSQRKPASPRFRPIFIGTLILLMAVFAATRWLVLIRNQEAREGSEFPQKAVAFLHAGAYPPRVFVYYDWGGYAIWKLYPSYSVFVDGRADLYGDELLHQFKTAVLVRDGWREILSGWKVETVLIPPSSALAQALLLDPSWQVIFSDSKAIVLLRRHPAVKNAAFSVFPWTNPVVRSYESEKMFPRPL